MTYAETDELADLFAKKQQSLIQLYELAQRQSVLIDSSDMTQLLKVLVAKQHLIESVRVIEKEKQSERTLQAKPNQVTHQLEAAHAGGLERGAYHVQERPRETTRLGMLDLTSDV